MDEFQAQDLSVLTAAPDLGGGSQTPGTMSPFATVDDAAGASSPAPAQWVRPLVLDNTYSGNALASGRTPTLGERWKDAFGSVQSAIVSPAQALGNKAAKAVGASDSAASTVGAALVPVLILAAVVAVVVHFVRKRTRTVKL